MSRSRLFQFRYSYERDLTDVMAKITMTSPSSSAPSMGAASPYALVANSTITNTGASVITGNLGLSPGTSVTGFPPGTMVSPSTQNITTGPALNAQTAVTAAYNDLAARTPTANETGIDMGTLTLTPGVYKWNTSAALTGTMVLDGGGDPNAVFIFQIGTTLTTAAASAVSLINSAQAKNVFFQVGTSATLGTTTTFRGNILANVSITLTTGATVTGGLYARTGAITLDTNTVTFQPIIATPVLTNARGISTMVRNSVGNYTITLRDNFFLFMHASAMFQSGTSAPAAPNVNIESEQVSNNITPSLIIQCRDYSGAPTDPASGEIMLLNLVLRSAST